MTYVPAWERLPDALARVRKETGAAVDETQKGICQAISDGVIKIRGQLRLHQTRRLTSKLIHAGVEFQIPDDLLPSDLDWELSRPLKAWFLRQEFSRVSGFWFLERVELNKEDVTKAFGITTKNQGGRDERTKRADGKRSSPSLKRVLSEIKELYPKGVPSQVIEPNKILCRKVHELLEKKKLRPVSEDTILRAAGRRK